MRKIDRVVYLNLARRPDRRAHILGEFDRNHYPMELVEWFRARDGFDYPSTEEICAAMRADGFGASVARCIQNGLRNYHAGDFACLWSKLSMFRYFIETGGDETWMFIEDDCIIQKDWSHIREIVTGLPADFRLLQLGYWHLNQFDERLEKSPTYLNSRVYSSDVCHGLGGLGEYAMVMNAAGARLLWEWSDVYVMEHVHRPCFHLDCILWERSFDYPVGCYYTKPHYFARFDDDGPDDSDRNAWWDKIHESA